jgi:lipid-A-disaccharide synthase
VDGGIHPLLSSADLALVASGTATLEAALCGTPMIVVYRTAALSYAIGKALIHVRWISLVNILAGKEVVPELLQGQVNADRLEQEGESLLMSPGRLQRMRDGLAAVAQELGPPGASGRAAEAILEGLEPTTSRLAVPASDAAP